MRVAVVHAAASEEAQALVKTIKEKVDPAELVMTQLTPVLSVQEGPDVVGVCAYNA